MNSEEIQKQIAELAALRSQAKYWRLGVTLGILTLVLGGVAAIVNACYSLAKEGPKQELFISELTTGLKRDVVPSVERIAKQTVNELKPAIEKELKKLNDRTPELMEKFNKEAMLLQNNLPKRGEKVLNNTFGTMLKKREAKVREMFPDATEQKISALVVNLTDEAENQMHSLTERLFGSHLKAITAVFANLETIQTSEAVNTKDEVPTWEMAVLVFDILREELKDLDAESLVAADTASQPIKLPVKKKTAAAKKKEAAVKKTDGTTNTTTTKEAK